ncbi:ISL3 family transposase [uncultured Desulfobulbus sp.]|uniref:ISL3 family transposase n=1 Tax=uncultured Desulfobulbus sp. TaxID=239745 RepID=UPI0029C706EA|nr:ISL3 family transposase [uncultured Desulfobulbus sp.]
MLVEQIIKQTVDLQGFRVHTVTKDSDGIIAEIRPDARHRVRCGSCGHPAVYRDRREVRFFRHVPLWNIPVWVKYVPRRVSCSRCGGVRTEKLPWVTGKQRFTLAYSCYLAKWAEMLPWYSVAKLFSCAWGTVATAVKSVVKYGMEHRDLSGITHIGIDEISRKKGHVYLTNVYDLRSKTLIWSGVERTKDTLRSFFNYLGPERTNKLQGICCDMWKPYVEVIKECAPQATLVFDKFHIVRHLMEAVDQVRRDEIREKGKEHKELMKDSRYIWLKNPWNLTPKQRIRLSSLEHMNLKINRAYLLKERFRDLWSYKTKTWARKHLKQWFWWATHSRLEPLREFAWMVRRHEENILTWFHMPISNGTVEGLNNKAKVVSHKAYGFRTADLFICNLYHCMGNLPAIPLMHRFM